MEYKNVNSGFGYVIRLERGEKVASSLIQLAEKENITGAFFYGIGAVENSTIGRFNTETKEYEFQDIVEVMELVSVKGNVSRKDGKPVVHIHGVLADEALTPIAGHIKEATVAVTCEIFMHLQHGTEMVREHDDVIGIDTLHFE